MQSEKITDTDPISEKKPEKDEDVHLNWPKIIGIGLIPIIIIFLVFFFALKSVGTENYMYIVDYIDENFGLLGIFLYVLIVDFLILPLSPDFVFPVVASMTWYKVIPVIGIASSLGGVLGYATGRLLYKIPLIRRFANKAMDKWGAYIRKYGIAFIILAALTPIPFSTICVAAGVAKLPSRKAIPACFFRIIRMAVYFCLFKAGFALA